MLQTYCAVGPWNRLPLRIKKVTAVTLSKALQLKSRASTLHDISKLRNWVMRPMWLHCSVTNLPYLTARCVKRGKFCNWLILSSAHYTRCSNLVKYLNDSSWSSWMGHIPHPKYNEIPLCSSNLNEKLLNKILLFTSSAGPNSIYLFAKLNFEWQSSKIPILVPKCTLLPIDSQFNELSELFEAIEHVFVDRIAVDFQFSQILQLCNCSK